MRKRASSWSFFFLVLAAAIAGCGDSDTPANDRVTKSIGPEGGELVSADGALSIVVPEGALEETVELSCDCRTA